MDSPLGRQFIPQANEGLLRQQLKGLSDPIGDQAHFVAPQLIHRYRNRALFLPHSTCPVICRYCFRKNELARARQSEGKELFLPDFQKTFTYLRRHPEIDEVIFSGGDPLVLSESSLDFYLEAFSSLPSLKYIRFHTRFPTVLPSRITDDFMDLLSLSQEKKRFQAFHIVVHINHRDELDKDVLHALEKLQKGPVNLLAQSVLLKGVNDDISSLKGLYDALNALGIRPYYLHHPDRVKGAMHFGLSLEEGRHLYAQLRDLLPGWAIPHYVVDIPGGKGKVSAFNPESYHYQGTLIDKDGRPQGVEFLT